VVDRSFRLQRSALSGLGYYHACGFDLLTTLDK
jgi:hypothetical protein